MIIFKLFFTLFNFYSCFSWKMLALHLSFPYKLKLLSNNSPAYIVTKTINFGRFIGFEMCTIPPYNPESNSMAEAFVKTFKRDYVYVSDLSSAEKVIEQLPTWFNDYNNNTPHKGLKMLSLREYYRFSQENLKKVKCN